MSVTQENEMECKRTQFEANIDKRRAVKVAEQNGCIADSHQVRLNLMARVRVGELSLPEAQAELRRIQKSAVNNGLVTRQMVFDEA